ncbi:MAG: thiamine pyrophosphate-dependent dehydrogenase E1 component subunit alpha [Lachnospiraceae bacterium]|nr:thiamine pyrophosphate-dependent dehydrogenase E1 component subunit alpha [Lachnospiraceae bacterium]
MSISKEKIIEMYRELLAVRMAEEKLVEIYALGKVPGHIHSGVGEEAAYVVPLMTRKEGDYSKFTHRVIAATHTVGITFNEMFAEILGKDTGTSHGRGGVNHVARLDKGIIGVAGSLGVDTEVAIGAGLSAKYLENGRIVYCFNGDGTHSRGNVHEAMNLAAMWKLPVLFVCDDNQFAISANHKNTISTPNPAYDRAPGYGMPAKLVQGDDPIAVYEAAEELTDYIREGKGPAVLEVKTYRRRGHFEGDQCAYRDAAEAEEMKKRDCIDTLEKYIREHQLMTEEDMDLLKKEIAVELDQAVEYAEQSPAPALDSVYLNVY